MRGDPVLLKHYQDRLVFDADLDGCVLLRESSLAGHLWNVSALDFCSNGLLLASGSWDKSVKVWDLSPLGVMQTLHGHTAPVTTVSWAPSVEFLLVSGSADNSLVVWNAGSGEILSRLQGHGSWVLDSSFTTSGDTMASCSWDGSVLLWDMITLHPTLQLKGHSSGVWACAFGRHNRSLLCTGSQDNAIRVWDLREDKKWHSEALLRGVHGDAIKCVAWSPCGEYVVAGSSDAKISVWDMRVKKVINCLQGHTGSVDGLCFIPDTDHMMASVGDTHCFLWNAFDPDGRSICGVEQHEWGFEVEAVAVSPDGTLICTGSVDRAISLSTLEVSGRFLDQLFSNGGSLPLAHVPVKTESGSEDGQDCEDGATIAFNTDQNCGPNGPSRPHSGPQPAVQTVRIRQPVTSSSVYDQINDLKPFEMTKRNDQEAIKKVRQLSQKRKLHAVKSRDIVAKRDGGRRASSTGYSILDVAVHQELAECDSLDGGTTVSRNIEVSNGHGPYLSALPGLTPVRECYDDPGHLYEDIEKIKQEVLRLSERHELMRVDSFDETEDNSTL